MGLLAGLFPNKYNEAKYGQRGGAKCTKAVPQGVCFEKRLFCVLFVQIKPILINIFLSPGYLKSRALFQPCKTLPDNPALRKS